MSKQKVTIEVDIPDGYETAGEFRPPCTDDYFITTEGTKGYVPSQDTSYYGPRIILRKIAPEIRTGFINVRDDMASDQIWTSREEADIMRPLGPGHIACIEVKYEVPRAGTK